MNGADDRARLSDVILIALVTGVTTALMGYAYVNVAQLPQILRYIDPSFAPGDFFLDATQEFTPRLYFARILALFARIAPLPVVFVGMLIVVNALIAAVSYLTARDLFRGSRYAALFACCAVMSVHTFTLGYKATIAWTQLISANMSIPLALVCVWAGLTRRPVISALAAGLATPIHPLIGMETGAVMLATYVVTALLPGRGGAPRRLRVRSLVAAVVILGASGLLWVAPYMSTSKIPTGEFIDILARFRAPHHYIPSSLGLFEYAWFACFLVGVAVAWRSWSRLPGMASFATRAVPVFVSIILLLCAGGYLFVEVIPTRIWTSAQTLRLVILVQWVGLVVVAGHIGYSLRHRREGTGEHVVYLLLVGMVTPPTMALTHLWYGVRKRFAGLSTPLSAYLGFGPILLVVVLVLVKFRPPMRSIFLLTVFVFTALAIIHLGRRRLAAFVVALGLMFAALFYAGGRLAAGSPEMAALFTPVFTLDDYTDDYAAAARFARDNTPADALFLTPPVGGMFRLIADRPIVVDFSCFPFGSDAMAEWYRRIRDCYGNTPLGGFHAANAMTLDYRRIDTDTLLRLQKEYGVTYAVLFRGSDVSLPVVYENQTFRIVRLPSG